jgi:hypothetical protein
MRRLAEPLTDATGGGTTASSKQRKENHVFGHSFHRRAREYDPAGCARADAMECSFAAPVRDPPCLAGGVCSALGTGVRFEGPIHRQLCSCASAQCRRGGGGAFLPIAEGRPSHRQQHQARCCGLRNCNATGYSVGTSDGRARWAEDTLFTPLEILRPIPGVARIPLAILMFATSEQSMIFICFIGAFFPILISTIHGVETLDKRLIHAAQEPGTSSSRSCSPAHSPPLLPV